MFTWFSNYYIYTTNPVIERNAIITSFHQYLKVYNEEIDDLRKPLVKEDEIIEIVPSNMPRIEKGNEEGIILTFKKNN